MPEVTSKIVGTQPKDESMQAASAEKNVFAQVEKWMALIREISEEKAEAEAN